MSDPVSWTNPKITCAHKSQINHHVVEPDVKSPHSFPVGVNKIKNTFILYGGKEEKCIITVYVRSCIVKSEYNFLILLADFSKQWQVNFLAIKEEIKIE